MKKTDDLHILGICGTFMGGLALLARALELQVSGSDANVYPPMSTQLSNQGIVLREGYHSKHLQPAPIRCVIGNALSRGNPAVEYLLDSKIPYTSGPQWLAEKVLVNQHVLAVAGTHGKTTTASMLAWILEYAGLAPGYLIGGIPINLGCSARLGGGQYFVVEADEYDTAFFDKRSKFLHYQAQTLIVNNLEFDHADIFPDLAAIQRQFHHLLRIIPSTGLVIAPRLDANVQQVLNMGCWTPVEYLEKAPSKQNGWLASEVAADTSHCKISRNHQPLGTLTWHLQGQHNINNALAAIAAANHIGVDPQVAIQALHKFQGVKRRMEVFGHCRGITLYDDFAHHPTAITTTLVGLRGVAKGRIFAVLEPRSNTMRMGFHQTALASALKGADRILLYRPADLSWDMESVCQQIGPKAQTCDQVATIIEILGHEATTGDSILIMSNGGFQGIHGKLLETLAKS